MRSVDRVLPFGVGGRHLTAAACSVTAAGAAVGRCGPPGLLWTCRCGQLWTAVDRCVPLCGPLWAAVYRSVDRCGPLWIAMGRCVPLCTAVYRCVPLWTAVGRNEPQ